MIRCARLCAPGCPLISPNIATANASVKSRRSSGNIKDKLSPVIGSQYRERTGVPTRAARVGWWMRPGQSLKIKGERFDSRLFLCDLPGFAPYFLSIIETADVVVIVSGIVGSSDAYHLAPQGCTNESVIE